MAKAESVARYFLWLAKQEPEPEPMTNMRLQKLLYYAQGWALAGRNEELFDGQIQAWQHGPVVREVYSKFKAFGAGVIPEAEASESDDLSDKDRAFLEWVWGGHGKYSAAELRRRTHAEPPWKNARGDMPEEAPSQAEISREALREYFLGEYRKMCRKIGIDADTFLASMEDARNGRTIPWEDIVSEFRRGVAH